MADEQGFPQLQMPFVVPGTGFINPPWYQLLLNLWKRTGGGGGTSSYVLTGSITAWGGATIPAGYLECDGAEISRVSYSNLFAAIDTTWGIGDGTTTFNLPDLRGRALYGDNGGTIPLGGTGGAASLTLVTNQLPAHNHGITDAGHSHTLNDPGHKHVVTDPGHVHAVTDPGHGHGVTDPGHVHTVSYDPIVDVDPGTGFGVLGAGATSTSSAATGLTVNNNGTGLSVNSHTTGVDMNNANTGQSVNSANSNVTTQNAGAGASITIQNPYAGVKYIIKT